MSVAGVSGSSLIPGSLFILTVTLIPSVSDAETLLIPWWHWTRGPNCQLPFCTSSCLANLWPCLGCCRCHTTPSRPITFSPIASILSLSQFPLFFLWRLVMKLPAGTKWTLLFFHFYKRLWPFSSMPVHSKPRPSQQKLNGHALEEDKIIVVQAARSTKAERLNDGTLGILKFN